jgi:hypothetical protein
MFSFSVEYISEDPRRKKKKKNSQPATPRLESSNELHELPLKRNP